MARYIAKNVVAADLCDVCELELAYAIGVSEPVSFFIECHNTEKVDIMLIKNAIAETFDLRPSQIIQALDLKQPIFSKTSSYGHFGQDNVTFPWERLDKVAKLKEIIYNSSKDKL